MNDKERVKRVYEWLKFNRNVLSFEDLGEKIGYTKSSISRMLSAGYKAPISMSFLKRLSELDPKINKEWLINGIGEMINDNVVDNSIKDENHSNGREYFMNLLNVTVAPLVGYYAQAGYLRGYGDPEYLDKQPYYVAATKHSGGNYVAFEIKGDSMADSSRDAIYDGDIVLGRELDKTYWTSKLHIPEIFIIVHKEEGIIIKQIVEHDVKNGIITCRSLNPNKHLYPDFTLDLRDIQQLFYKKELRRI